MVIKAQQMPTMKHKNLLKSNPRLADSIYPQCELMEADPPIAVLIIHSDHPPAVLQPLPFVQAEPPHHTPQLLRRHVAVLVPVEHVERLLKLLHARLLLLQKLHYYFSHSSSSSFHPPRPLSPLMITANTHGRTHA